MSLLPDQRAFPVNIRLQYSRPIQRAVYLVEINSAESLYQINRILLDLAPRMRSVRLSTGRIYSFAVALDTPDSLLLDQLEDFLKAHYPFVVQHRSADECIFRVIESLCAESKSTQLPIDTCDKCGKPEPFPELLVKVMHINGRVLGEHEFCAHCAAEISTLKGIATIRHFQQTLGHRLYPLPTI